MKFKIWLSSLVIIVIFTNFKSVLSQSKIDTLYFDENWSICEKPVAMYHRVCTLNLKKSIFYIGNVNDYYENGVLVMSGSFNDEGLKNGLFKFYRKNGTLLKEGNFEKGIMKGIWNYYNNKGILIAKFDCKNEIDITPILLVNEVGDTLIKNGNGHFIFYPGKGFGDAFTGVGDYTVEGSVENGKKKDDYYYWIGEVKKFQKTGIIATETYKNGLLKKVSQGYGERNMQDKNEPIGFINLMKQCHVNSTDNFVHSNMVWGYGSEGDQKLINFLANGTIPEMQSESQSYEENIKDLYNIIGTVIRSYLKSEMNKNINYTFPHQGNKTIIYSFSHPLSTTLKPKDIHFKVNLNIDESGYVTNSVFKGNLGKEEIGKMNYYFSRLSGLKPLLKNGQPISSEINIGFISLFDENIDETKNEKIVGCRYIAYNADSTDMIQHNNVETSTLSDSADKPAEAVGGKYGWRQYLERNLNSLVAIDNGAKPGTYTVKVNFIVDADGSISDVKATNDPGYGTAQEAIRVISKMPKWIPATKNGKPIKSLCNQSITFVVSKE